LTLPAHESCNKSTEKDEESVMVLLGASMHGRDRPGNFLAEKAVRALRRPEAPGLRADFLSRMIHLGAAGGAIGIPEGRMTRVLAKIAKGVLFKNEGRLVPQGNPWWSFAIDEEVFREEEPFTHLSHHHDVLVTRWVSPESEPNSVMWLMSFFGLRFYTVITSQPGQSFADICPASDALHLTWPLGPSPTTI
jgi:hypothetical protein